MNTIEQHLREQLASTERANAQMLEEIKRLTAVLEEREARVVELEAALKETSNG